jgi:hypothetical protein
MLFLHGADGRRLQPAEGRRGETLALRLLQECRATHVDQVSQQNR